MKKVTDLIDGQICNGAHTPVTQLIFLQSDALVDELDGHGAVVDRFIGVGFCGVGPVGGVVGCGVVGEEGVEEGRIVEGVGEEGAAHGHHEPGGWEAECDFVVNLRFWEGTA